MAIDKPNPEQDQPDAARPKPHAGCGVAPRERRRIVILTEGNTEPITAKTAASVIRYRTSEVVALLDSTQQGETAQALLGVGGEIPVVGSLDDVPRADTVMIGIAPSGGRIPADWRAILLDAISRGMDIVSGLHDFLCDDPALAEAARQHQVQLVDVRKNDERDVAQRKGIRDDCLRIHTVGNDCCVGKMVVAIEVTRALQRRGHDAKFVATGQTGIMIEGDGCAVDCVVSDFVSGAAENLILASQHHPILLVEGQGCLAHPKYSAVTLGLLHGCSPHGLILCYAVGREGYHGMEQVPLTPLPELRRAYEIMAGFMQPSPVIGVAMNTRNLDAADAETERQRIRTEMGLPACDVFRDGPDELVEAVLDLRSEVMA
jgi:uncharacterized NAD-dependent epimerase/dehydratase family protein